MDPEKIKKIAKKHYLRKDVQKALFEQSKNREFVPRFADAFGKRPDSLEYPGDLMGYIEKGATSFHVSEEHWKNPLELNTNLSPKEIINLRLGWDLIIDIDCPFLEYSRVAASLIIEALQFHGIQNLGLKFSGKKGWHIGLGFQAFPEKIHNTIVRDFFPEGPRMIAAYIQEMIKKSLTEQILDLSSVKEISKATGKPEKLLKENNEFNPYSILEIDTVLIAPRHLYRTAYSLNEKSLLVSTVIKPDQLKRFHPSWAKPSEIIIKPFLPKPEKNEAKELFVQAIDWYVKNKQKSKADPKIVKKPHVEIKLNQTQIENSLPPCITNILNGLKYDGRKRGLFILINFFRSLGLDNENLEKVISNWNKKNYKPLKESYIKGQLNWFKKQKPRLPPNCKKYYEDLTVCEPVPLCNKIKNPVPFVIRNMKLRKSSIKRKKTKTKYNTKKPKTF